MLDKTSYTALPPVRSIHVRTINAHTISASKSWDARKRAHLAARWARGLINVKPTVKLATDVFGANSVYVQKELRALDGITPPSPLEAAWANADMFERLAFVRTHLKAVWDVVDAVTR